MYCMELFCVVLLMNTVLSIPSESVPMSVHDKERIKIFDWIETFIAYSVSLRSLSMSFSAMSSCSDSDDDCAFLQMVVPKERKDIEF